MSTRYRVPIDIARRYAVKNMIDRVKVVRQTEPMLNTDGTIDVEQGTLVYEGPGRVYSVAGPMAMGIGDEPTVFSTTYVSVPLEWADAAVDVHIDDIVEVLEHSDPMTSGRFFAVMDVQQGGTLPIVRRLQVQGIQPSHQWDHIPDEWIP